MAKTKKAAEPVETIHREVLPNGDIKLTSPKGFIDTRTNRWYKLVICDDKHERFFVEAE